MDPNRVESVAEQALPSTSINYKPDIFAGKGVFSDGDAFSCLVCNKLICNVLSIPMHTIGKTHCLKLEEASANCTKDKEQFVCKLCTDYRAVDWKTFLRHFNEKKHFEVLKNEKKEALNKSAENSKFSYITMMMNQIIEHESGTFYCCCCEKLINGQSLILDHINEENHKKLQEKRGIVKFSGKLQESPCRILVKNFLFHKNLVKFYCNLCKCLISTIKNCFEHIYGCEHSENRIIRETLSKDTCHQSLPGDIKANKKSTIPPTKLSQDKTESVAKLMLENSITGPTRKGQYHCKLCGKMLSGEKTIASHISGYQHKILVKNSCKKLTTATESKETSEGSSSSWESTGNSSESWETYEGESQSYDSYGNSSWGWKSSDSISDSWETISIQGSLSERQGSTLFDVPPNLIPLISKHYLQHLEKELFCTLCEAHLRSPQSIVAHTRSKYHVAELNRYNDQIAKKNKTLLATSTKNTATKSATNITNKQLSQPDTKHETGTVIRTDPPNKAGGPQSKLLEIPQKLIPLISKHLLQHQEKEIFCVACQVRMQSPQSLIAHTKSRNHVIKLNDYKAGISQKRKDPADTSGRSSTSSSVSHAFGKKKFSESVNTKHEVSTRPKTLITASQTSQPKLFRIPDYLIPLLTPHHLQRSESEIFCLACQVRLLHPNNMIEHISSKTHIARLENYKAEIARKSDNINKIFMNMVIDAPVHVVNERPLTANPQNQQSRRMEIPKNLLPLIKKHSLKHLEDEIYCGACQVHIKHVASLVSHTNSPRHAAKLRRLRANATAQKKKIETQVYENKKLQPNVVNPVKESKMMKLETPNKPNTAPNVRSISGASGSATGLENSLNKLTIADSKGEKSGKLPQDQLQNLIKKNPKHIRIRKPDTRLKKSRAFDPKYLKVDMQHIYEVDPEKLRIMELSCQLCFPKTSNMIYCLICEKSVSTKLQTFYEHICSFAHTAYLADAEKNDKHFINYPDQFSDLSLAKEFMQEGPEDGVQCCACDASVQNDDTVIREHLNGDLHKKKKQLWNERMQKILQDILVEMKATWYNIQKYWCQPCDIEYNTEFHFAEHMESKKHNKSLKKIKLTDRLVYDSCMTCATLWLSSVQIYAHHCEEPMHKYLLQSGDFYVFKLPNQATTLLENAEAEVMKLIQLSDQVLTVQKMKADALLKCLEDTVNPIFPHAKAYPFGSRVSGLGFPNSDIDVFLDCGTYDGNNTTKDYQEQLIISVERCLYANQQSWEIEETLVSTRTPIIKLYHRDTELSCDVSFKNGLSVENTKLLKCFIDNYPPCRKLMLFLKKWLSLCNLSGSQYITNYATCWYVIFYLQSKGIVPSVASLIAKENKSKIIDGWETGVSEAFDVCEQEYTFTELLHGFFNFYTNFDFRYSVACPILGRTVPKQDFTELDLLPKEMAPYINHVVTKSVDGLVELFRIDSEMCIQDPYDLSHNLTKAVRKYTLNRFRRLCARSADLLNNFIQH